jgi:hypothetical protein
MRIVLLVLPLVFLLAFLLASPALAQDNPMSAASRFACGPGNVEFTAAKSKDPRPMAQPEAGKALVYVIAVKSLGLVRVGLDGAWVGAVNDTSSVSFAVDPGEHHLCANWQSRMKDDPATFAFRSFTAESGKVYYFKTTVNSDETRMLLVKLQTLNNEEGGFLAAAAAVSISHPKK